MTKPASPDPQTICFGLSSELDRRSCASFLQLLGNPELAETLASRLSPEEIEEFVELGSSLLRRHLSKEEYHRLFLGEDPAHRKTD